MSLVALTQGIVNDVTTLQTVPVGAFNARNVPRHSTHVTSVCAQI